jgi:uncharacterized protein (DUF2141 family)
MSSAPRIVSMFTMVALTAILCSCANIGRPSGGEKDSRGPEVIGTIPFPGTLNFASDQVVFYFDEFIKPGNYRDEVFISPVPAVDPEITVKNKMLRIKFLEPLRDSTTYVITLGTGIVDFNESNKMDKSYIYAFSTGDVLDSLEFSGQASDMWTGKGEKEMKVVLFREGQVDSSNSILKKRPEYVAVTDKEGLFDFRFLAPGRYKIFAISDPENDFQYTTTAEKIGIAQDPWIDLQPGDSAKKFINLQTFVQDLEGPKVKSARWSNDHTIHLEFAEPIRVGYGPDSLGITLMDTLKTDSAPVVHSRFRHRDQRHLYIHSPKARNQDMYLRFTNLMDSLGHKRDTLVRVSKQAQIREEKGKWFEAPINLPIRHDFLVPAYFLLPANLDTSMVQLRDTSKKAQALELQVIGLNLVVKPAKQLDPFQIYELELKEGILKPDGQPLDTTVRFKMRFPNPNEFGTISGKVLPDSTRPDARFVAIFRGGPGSATLVMSIQNEKGEKGGGGTKRDDAGKVPDFYEQRFSAPGPFKFVYLKPGRYSLDLIDDVDGNGVLSPGSLNPYRLPEKVYHQSEQLEIRAKWDYNDVEVYPIPSPVKGKGEGSEEGEDEKSDDKPPSPNPKGGK